jgi:hypothetical protein
VYAKEIHFLRVEFSVGMHMRFLCFLLSFLFESHSQSSYNLSPLWSTEEEIANPSYTSLQDLSVR